MNRIDRLFAILLIRSIRARDLSEQFEIGRRTIYRDLSALTPGYRASHILFNAANSGVSSL